MRKYYTRPCNFYYGNCAKKLIKEKKALPLAGRSNLAFDHVEVFDRQKKKIIKNNYYSITKIQKLEKKKDKYSKIKEGMMQKLLTGEIRLQ